MSFERPYARDAQGPFYVRFLESLGYDVSYATDVDIDRDPTELSRHRLIIIAGHSEYWSRAERDALENARDDGTNLAFLGANDGYWQARYSSDRSTIIEYKSVRLDPEPNQADKTDLFRNLRPPRPECEILGAQSEHGLARDGDAQRDYVVTPAAARDRWFLNTGLQPGAVLPDAVGYEWDVAQPGCVEGAEPTVLFHYSGVPPDADAVRYVSPSGARIFDLGTMQLIWSLDNWGHKSHATDLRFGRFMRNVLDDMTRPSAPRAVHVDASAGAVTVRPVAPQDPRVRYVAISRRPRGSSRFTLLCRVRPGGACLDRRAVISQMPEYAAVTVDAWGASYRTLATPGLGTPVQHARWRPGDRRSGRNVARDDRTRADQSVLTNFDAAENNGT